MIVVAVEVAEEYEDSIAPGVATTRTTSLSRKGLE